MAAFLEPVVFILRVGPESTEYGKPYTASATVVKIGDGMCEVKGLSQSDDSTNGLALFKDAQRALADAGFSEIKWDRKRESKSKTVTVKLNGIL